MTSDWLKNTGEMPVSRKTKVDVKFKNFDAQSEALGKPADYWFWELDGSNGQITEYRVLADKDGWIENSGVQPVANGVVVEVKCNDGDVNTDEAIAWAWRKTLGITHWRHAVTATKAVEIQRTGSSTLAQQVADLEEENVALKSEVDALKAVQEELRAKLDAIRGLSGHET